MKTHSCKAKGRRLQDAVVQELRTITNLSEKDIRPAIMGESGCDVKYSDLAHKMVPFDIECKNCESLNIWSAFSQAESNSMPQRFPMLVFKRNRSDILCCLRFSDILTIYKAFMTHSRQLSHSVPDERRGSTPLSPTISYSFTHGGDRDVP